MPRTESEWHDFWSRAWWNLGNVLGLVSVVCGFIWLGWWLLFGPPIPTAAPRVEHSQTSTQAQASRQSATNSLMTANQRPCAVKRRGERVSDVKGCSLFRLRLGMGVNEVSEILESSGYFSHKAPLTNRCDPEKGTCVHTHYIHQQRDGFSVTADFAPKHPKDKALILKQIALWFGPGTNPYYDPEGIRSTFVKVFGPPDASNPNSDNWGGYSSAHIQGYTYNDRRYAVIFRDSGNFGAEIDSSSSNLFRLSDGQRIDAINTFEGLEEDVQDAYQEAKQGPDRNCLKKLKDEISAAHRELGIVSRLIYKSAGMVTKADETAVNDKLKITMRGALQTFENCSTNVNQIGPMCNEYVNTKGALTSNACKEAATLLKEFVSRLQ